MAVLADHESLETRVQHELETLRAYALRWSVLAAWRSELRLHKVPLAVDPAASLERARIKLASGCFSACDVGCDLAAAEAALTAADTSQPESRLEFWLELLGQAMSNTYSLEHFLQIPTVQVHYQNCGIAGCACDR